MKRSFVCSLLGHLLLALTFDRAFCLYVDQNGPSPVFTYTEDEIIAQINSYDEKYIAFLTDKHFSIYKFKDGTIDLLKNIKHDIENASEEHLASVMTHKYIAYITRDALYYFKLEDDRTNLTAGGRQVFPSNYFNITEFTKELTLNSRTFIMLMKTGPREIHMLNFKDSLFPSSRKLLISSINPTSNITQFKLVANAERIALQFSDHSVHVIDPDISSEENKEIITSTKVKVADGYQVENIAYDYTMNFLILLTNYTKTSSLEGHGNPRVCAMLYSCRDKKYEQPVKTLDFKDMNLNAETLLNASIRRTGTHIMLVNFNNTLFTYNMDPFYPDHFLGKLEIPKKEIDEGYKLNNTFTLSNWIQISRCIQKNNDLVDFRYLRLLTNRSIYCHSTNRHHCTEPFVPGSKKTEVAMSFTASASIMLVMLVVFIRSCTGLEMLLSKSNNERKKRDSLDESAPEITSIG